MNVLTEGSEGSKGREPADRFSALGILAPQALAILAALVFRKSG
jgi:hypothetical protein